MINNSYKMLIGNLKFKSLLVCALAFTPFVMGGCSTLPTSWFGSDDAPDAADIKPLGDYPNLADVPARPPVPETRDIQSKRDNLEKDQKAGDLMATEQRDATDKAKLETKTVTTTKIEEIDLSKKDADKALPAETKEVKTTTLASKEDVSAEKTSSETTQKSAVGQTPGEQVTNVEVGTSYNLIKNAEGNYALRRKGVGVIKASLVTAVYFPADKAELTMAQYNNLKRIAETSKGQSKKLRVVGYLSGTIPASVDFEAEIVKRTLIVASYLIDLGANPANLTVQLSSVRDAKDATAVSPIARELSQKLDVSRVDVLFDKAK